MKKIFYINDKEIKEEELGKKYVVGFGGNYNYVNYKCVEKYSLNEIVDYLNRIEGEDLWMNGYWAVDWTREGDIFIKTTKNSHLYYAATQSNDTLDNNIKYKQQITFNDLKNIKPLRYDFGIYENGKLVRLIEFDGIQHFEEQNYFTHDLTITKNNDIIKNKYSKDNNIPLDRIPYWEKDKMTLDMLLGEEYLIE